jgi:hypothetical protein
MRFRGARAFLLTEKSTRGVHVPLIRVTKMLRTKVHVNSDAREANQFVSQGETMTFSSLRTIRPLLALVFAFLTACAAAAPALAQEKKVAQQNGVDNTKMGAYRALAQHLYADFQRGDLAAAAELGTILERLWDKAEEYGGDTALAKTNRKLFDEIDKAMDQFITPITEAKGKPPDPAKVKAAYNTYLEKLKLAD